MTAPTVYAFGERLRMSQGVSANASVGDVLMANIPGATKTYRATESEDRSGTDWWIETMAGRKIAVDCKIRQSDWAATHPDEDDLALETWSAIESGMVGWTRDVNKATDYVLWLWQDTGRWCLVPFPMLCSVFADNWIEWSKNYRTKRQTTPRGRGAYQSECVFVPRVIVWRSIYERFGGKLLAVAA